MIKTITHKIRSSKDIVAYIVSFLFILLNGIFITNEMYFFMLIPFVLVVLYLALFALDLLLMIIIFIVPLSIPLQEFTREYGFNMSLPAEPLLFGVLIVFVFKLLTEKKFDKKVAYHPISIAIYINLIWMMFTTISSSNPLVSVKFVTSRLWFLVAFYFLGTQLFQNYKNIKRSIWLYVIPLLIVVAYTIIRHISYGIFDRQVAHWVMSPFYNDHTAYAAILAMYLPVLLGLATKSNYSINLKFIVWLLVVYLVIAIVLSYTRAAWLSLVGTLGVWLVIKLKIKFRTLLFLGVSLIALFFIFQTQIFIMLEKNEQDSSADLSEHVKSMSNISSDASNLERINRWKSALRMFCNRPVLGFGPGTYQFEYAPYQFSYELTIISTNAGDGGNAHSEYIGPLAETGVLGSLSFIAIVILTIYTAIKLYHRLKDKEMRMLVLSCLLGLITYFLHGFLNNFLDTDKASVPFWGFIAIIVAIDVYHSKKSNPKISA